MIVIITGGSRGIGYAVAQQYATGGNILLLASRQKEFLEESVSKLKKDSEALVHSYACDLSKEEEVMKFAEWCLAFGSPDILVNNAGIYIPGSVYDEADGNMESTMQVNFYSAYHLSRALLPAMISKGQGHIFNICSIAALDAYPGGGSYSVSKFALSGFTKNLRSELKDTGIKVTGVYPGAVFTDSWKDFDNSHNRIMEASDIAKMIFAAGNLSVGAVVEDIVMRPQKGDL